MSNPDRAWTAEQLLKLADRVETCNRVSVQREAASALRFAATLRQQTTNPPEIGSRLVGQQAEQAGEVVSDGTFSLPKSFVGRVTTDDHDEPAIMGAGGVDSIKRIAEEMVHACVAERQGDAEFTQEAVDDWAHRIMCFADYVPSAALEAVAPLLRAPAEQAALAQNAQGKAVGWISDNDLRKMQECDDEARNVRVSHVRTHLRVHQIFLQSIHAERARVPATDADIAAWAERHDLSFGGSKIDARSAFEDAETLHLAAAPSAPEGDGGGE